MAVDLSGLQTEARNPRTTDIDKVSTLELCQIINSEDAQVADAVATCIATVSRAIDSLVERIQKGGRIVYVGAGTSGRLGVLDASELPPTFTADPQQFIALISGGDNALRHAQEGAEDNVAAAVGDLKALKLNGNDAIIGIAASGRTPYVLSCLAYARSIGCCTVGVACSDPSLMSTSGDVDHMISAVTGPEVVAGSTRMKAGTATKLILNMLSTGTMIKIGKTFGNIMIDVKATNMKLKQRSRNILRTICGDVCPTDAELDTLLESCDSSVKLAAASLMLRSSVADARDRLAAAGGVLAKVLNQAQADFGVVDVVQVNGTAKSDYVLCVDGGGTKCAAVIRSRDGQSWRGEDGPCNPTDVGIEAAVSSVAASVEQAANKCPGLKGNELVSISFAQVWIGLAGYDRPAISAPVHAALKKLFSRSMGSTFRITTDIEMLVAAAAQRKRVDSAVALIAGTGSIAMVFSREGDKFVRTGRSGGWGYLLGDDGSGFDIGRQALRHCLSSLDRQRSGIEVPPSCISDCLLCQRVLDRFAPDRKPDQIYDILSAIISPTEILSSGSVSNVKKRIASVAPLVLDLSNTDPTAKAIIDGATYSLVELLQTLLIPGRGGPSDSILILAGGLMQSETFQAKLKGTLANFNARGAPNTAFAQIEWVSDPAAAGAESLFHQSESR